MVKIKYFGYDRYELNHDLGPGKLISTHSTDKDINGVKGKKFDDYRKCLRFIANWLGTKCTLGDWTFEEDLDDKGNDGWVLHIIVENGTMKFATHNMIEKWKKCEKPELIDLLVNVFVENC